jgi:hypothetical protein
MGMERGGVSIPRRRRDSMRDSFLVKTVCCLLNVFLFFFLFVLFFSFLSFGKILGRRRKKGGWRRLFRASSRLAMSSYVRARSRDMPFCSHWQRNNALLLFRGLSSSYTSSTHFLADCLSQVTRSIPWTFFTSVAIKHAPCFLEST